MSNAGTDYRDLETGALVRRLADEESELDSRIFAAVGGAFPLRVRGSLIGAVGVSGLELHDDHALVVEPLRAHKTGLGE